MTMFASPEWLWALLAVPHVPRLAAWARRVDQERTSRLVARALWPRVLVRPWPRWRLARVTLLTIAAAGIVLALARPQWGIVREKVEREGVDVVIVLDTSGSMATEDVAPNRFFLARAALMSLVSRLQGDRIGLLAFEGEAYPLVPLTLDADAVGLFLETLEPGVVPAPGSSIGQGLAKGLDMFVDESRRNKVLVLISDGEDLEGDVQTAASGAKKAGVLVHTVGVGTERGEPVPEIDREGNRAGFKKDASGQPVISRMNPATLEAIARGTGGQFFRITPQDTSLAALASAIEGMEQKSLAREYAYKKKERFQVPLAMALACFAVALVFPLPRLPFRIPLRRRHRAGARAALWLSVVVLLPQAPAEAGSVTDEVLLRPRRMTSAGRKHYEQGNHPESLKSFEGASGLRPEDPAARFNLAGGLYKSGKFDEAEALFRALGADAQSRLAGPSRYNLGNTLFQKKDYPGAIKAYRDALRTMPDDENARRNLEMALRALQQQQQQRQQQNQQQQQKDPQNKDQQSQSGQSPTPQPSPGSQQQQQQQQKPDRPQTPEEKEQQRFQQEAGMPRERAMQLLDALQQNEKDEQKRLMAAKQVRKKGGKDW
jgi:Ca-activated chloride channel family protein